MSETICPRCGAALRREDAAVLSGPPGYLPVLYWCHQRPDGKGKCRLYSGPPAGYADARRHGTITPTTLSAAPEAPERQR